MNHSTMLPLISLSGLQGMKTTKSNYDIGHDFVGNWL